MSPTIGLIAALSLASAAPAQLALTNVRSTYGVLGAPARRTGFCRAMHWWSVSTWKA